MLNEMMARGREAQNSAVRTREDQIASLSRHMRWDAKGKAESFILEAEARGAEEQRRKDAKGQEPVAHTSKSELDRVRKGKVGDMHSSPNWEGLAGVMYPIPLYTRPTNVAALEARVKEFEEEKLTFLRLVSRAQMCVPELYEGWHIDARAAFKREGGE